MMLNTMLDAIKNELNITTTENGDIAFKSTLNNNLDLFYNMGAMRHNESMLIDYFRKAYEENPLLAIANLLHLRNIRGGMGERKSFKLILTNLINQNIEADFKHIELILNSIEKYGRWEDIVEVIETDNKDMKALAIEIVESQLNNDIFNLNNNNPVSLLAKWLPSENASSDKTKRLAKLWRKALKMSPKKYRKTLSALRDRISIIETHLTEKDYTFDYSHIPSRAFKKYNNAFRTNDNERFYDFMEQVSNGEKSLKVDNLFPYEIIKMLDKDSYTAEELWNTYQIPKDNKNTLVIRDGSGSMLTRVEGDVTALDITDSLTLLFAEHIDGVFKDKFITFSSSPEFVEVKGTLSERVNYLKKYDDCSNTNLAKTFDLILRASKKITDPAEYIDKIVIVSDMEFDSARCGYYNWVTDTRTGTYDKSTHDRYKRLFELEGIPFPEIVYWNVASRNGTVPTTDLDNVKLVSGWSKFILDIIINDDTPDANMLMLKTLEPYLIYIEEQFKHNYNEEQFKLNYIEERD